MVKWIGIGLISSCILFGFGKWYSWPFTAYPTFDSMVETETNHLIYVGELESGKEIELTNAPLYLEMEYDIIESYRKNQLDTELLSHFISIYSDKSSKLKKVSVYIKKESILPEKRLEQNHVLIYSKECNK